MAEGIAPIYRINNSGNRNNCTLTVLYPAVISIKSVNVGGGRQDVTYDVIIFFLFILNYI